MAATAGFAVLVVVWTTMLVLPLVVFFWWCQWLQQRLSPSPSSYATGYGGTASGSHQPHPSHPAASPLAALYVVTLPLGLVWNGLLALTRPFRRSDGSATGRHPLASFVRPILLCAVLAFGAQLLYFHLFFTQGSPDYWRGSIRALKADDWFGYLDLLRVPRIFDGEYQDNAHVVIEQYANMDRLESERYTSDWLRVPELRSVALVTALRQAPLVGAVATGLQVVRKAS